MIHRFSRLACCLCALLVGITLISCTPKPGPEVIAAQVVTALGVQDIATINTLLDEAMPDKAYIITPMLRAFRDAQGHGKYTNGMGPIQSTTVQPTQIVGASTLVPVLLHFQNGEGSIDLTLHETPDGWRVLAWDFKPPHKRDS